MAGELTTKGTSNALLVIDAKTKQPIELPLNSAEGIMQPIVALQTWIKNRMRTGGQGKVEIGGKVWYYAYGKQMKADREIEITYDATGAITGGVYGAESAADYGYVKPTSKISLAKDYIEPKGAKFLKHLISKQDLKDSDLGTEASIVLADWNAEVAELALQALKAEWAAAFGTVGKWASDYGYTLPTTGTGKRVQAKSYTDTNAHEIIVDIRAVLDYKQKLGLKDGVEATYPFARGTNIANSNIISISPAVNGLLAGLVEKSENGFIAGLGINKELGVITSIASTTGQVVPVEIIIDAPQKDGKDFNWSVEEKGKNGAMACPNNFEGASQVRDHYEGVALLGSIIEAVGLVMGLKYLQPELNFASFGA